MLSSTDVGEVLGSSDTAAQAILTCIPKALSAEASCTGAIDAEITRSRATTSLLSQGSSFSSSTSTLSITSSNRVRGVGLVAISMMG
jgi:hypothetical protein